MFSKFFIDRPVFAWVIALFVLQVLPSADGVLLLHHQVLIALLAVRSASL